MCDFFGIAPEIQYEFSMWRSPEMGEDPHVQMMRHRMLISRSSGFTLISNFECMI